MKKFFRTDKLHNDIWQISTNKFDWERRYLHVNYSQNLNLSIPVEQPCRDVFWFPIISELLADHLVEEMEHFGKWSGGDHQVGSRLLNFIA